MQVRQQKTQRWNSEINGKLSFVPLIAPTEMDLQTEMPRNASMRMVMVMEGADMRMQFAGYARVLAEGEMTYAQIKHGQFVLLINGARNAIKMIVGNATDYPVLVSYKMPNDIALPRHAIQQVLASLLKKGDIQADERLRAAIGETLEELRERSLNYKR